MLDLAIPSNQRYRSKNDNDNKCSNNVFVALEHTINTPSNPKKNESKLI